MCCNMQQVEADATIWDGRTISLENGLKGVTGSEQTIHFSAIPGINTSF